MVFGDEGAELAEPGRDFGEDRASPAAGTS